MKKKADLLRSTCLTGVTIALLLLSILPAKLKADTIVLGESDGWRDLDGTDGVAIIEGKRGFTDITIEQSGYRVDEDTDLLLNFESNWADLAGGYRLRSTDGAIHRGAAHRGSFGAVLNGHEGVEYEPGTFSLFAANRAWDDITIEFWLYPTLLGDGSEILRWEGSNILETEILRKEVRVYLLGRRLRWRFDGLFTTPDQHGVIIELIGEVLLPRRWHHHLFRYKSELGLAEYLVDGKLIDITHSTPSGREESQSYDASTGSGPKTKLVIGDRFTGFIDEMRIQSSFIENPELEQFSRVTSSATTRVFDLGYSNSKLQSITADYTERDNSTALFYYRIDDRLKSSREVAGAWQPFLPGSSLPEPLYGRYLQLSVELLPAGSGEAAPIIHSISIEYEPDLPPHPPLGLRATAGNGSLEIAWQRSLDADVAGYLIYYGDRPRRYFGEDASEGFSPIDAGDADSFSLTGLTNGRLYYVAVASYDRSAPPHQSEFSEEISGRPTRVFEER